MHKHGNDFLVDIFLETKTKLFLLFDPFKETIATLAQLKKYIYIKFASSIGAKIGW